MKDNFCLMASSDQTMMNVDVGMNASYKNIKKLVCGSTFIVVCSMDDEIYVCGRNDFKIVKQETDNFWFKLNWKSDIHTNPKIKTIYATYHILIIQLENDELILNIERNTFQNGQLHYFLEKRQQKEIVGTSEIKSPIKCIGCSSRSSVVVTIDNKMYGRGDNQFDVLAGLVSKDKFTYMSTPFENESEIIDVKCGFFYTAVLLKNGKFYSVRNNTQQQNLTREGNLPKFNIK
ncbi:hypothetical protein ABK040_000979 [Willaertia magna]